MAMRQHRSRQRMTVVPTGRNGLTGSSIQSQSFDEHVETNIRGSQRFAQGPGSARVRMREMVFLPHPFQSIPTP